ncbi:MAG: CPCC family cysteine-rich protein [Chloroflexota bacterium]
MAYDGWYSPENPMPREQCPCCDYMTLPERKMYIICRVCFWEDDGTDIDTLDKPNWVNHMTLREARANFREFGASRRDLIPHVLPETERSQFEYRPRDIDD